MQNHQNYERTIYVGVEESLSKIAAKISSDSVVLDVGCGAGMLGAYLSEKKKCIVDGVDFDEAAIEICRSKYRLTAVRNLETEILTDIFPTATYDYIIVADVLEHLVNSDRLISELKQLIKKNGTIIFSVPNITHIAIGFELLFGYFEYKKNGLLDDTHLRFYSRKSLLNKLEACGLYAWEVDTVQKEIVETEFSTDTSNRFPRHWRDALIKSREDALTYQWLVSTKINPKINGDSIEMAMQNTYKPSLLLGTELYWVDKDSPNFSEQKRLIGHEFSKDEELSIIDFHFSECASLNGIQQLRIDPVSDQKPFLIVSAEIFAEGGDSVWKWQPKVVGDEFTGAKLVEGFDSVGWLFQANTNDPQWYPSVDKEVLCQVTAGWVFRLSIKVDESLFHFYNDELIPQKIAHKNDIETLQNDIAARQNDIAARQNDIAALQNDIAALQNDIAALRLSTSWRITKPLRYVSHWMSRSVYLFRLYRKYKRSHPGVRGFLQMIYRCTVILMKDGKEGLKEAIYLHEQRNIRQDYRSRHNVLMLEDVADTGDAKLADVAVHAHIYYLDLASDIRSYLENIPVNFHLYVTTDTLEKAKAIEAVFFGLEHVSTFEVQIANNVGRDIFPMLVTLGKKLVKHELVLHIHTKRSPHNTWKLGGWRRYLMESLLGNSERITAIIRHFKADNNLGILFPDYYDSIKELVYLGDESNNKNIEKLLLRAGKNSKEIKNVDSTFFPAGDMFWFRGEAIAPFIQMDLSSKDFEPEMGQVNCTLAHAIERMFPYFASEMGMTSQAYLANSFLSKENSAHKIELLKTYIKRDLIVDPTILFDHNAGGGTTTFTRNIVNGINSTGAAVLRVYCFDALWFVHWLGDGDGMLFYTSAIDELFDVLTASRGRSVILNSMYGYPDIPNAVSRIIDLVKKHRATLDIKMHDFYSACSSPHLMDFENKYCGVPQEHSKCEQCLKTNLSWYHNWYPVENRPIHISQWRKPFNDLFEAATTLTFFDQSSIEILGRAFTLEHHKIKVIPHTIDYFQCDESFDLSGSLHIGTLGSLSIAKGGKVINKLQRHIMEEGLDIPITVLGMSMLDLIAGIDVYGPYENSDLPLIVKQKKINVFFMPSIVPETFSYTISEAMQMGLPIVAFDIGAQGNRVKQYALGKVIPLGSSSDVILQALQSVLKTAQELK